MRYYFKQISESSNVVLLITYDNVRPNITDLTVVEITQEEYEQLSTDIEVSNQPEEPDPDEISAEEALDIILGVST